MRVPAGVVVVVLLLIGSSGLAGPAMAAGAVDQSAGPGSPIVENTDSTPPDPETDVIGWENGYWHNESIDVDQSDGLNESELNATVSRAMARVEVLRQLEFERTVPVEIVSREEFQRRQGNHTVDPTLRTFDNVKFEALFLVPETQDSIEVQNENSGSNILGQYNFRTKTMLIVSEDPTNLQIDEVTLAHELVHALQDQHFNLSRYDARTRDGANAQNGLIEGDASLIDYRYERACDSGEWEGTCLRPSSDGGGGDLAHVGTYMVKLQPYSEGPAFVNSLYAQGGWAAVNAAYDRPPASSEQIVHPEKYRVDPPRNVSLSDRNSDSWMRVRPSDRPDHASVGEAAVFVMLWYPGFDSGRQTEVVPYDSFLNVSGNGVSQFQPYLYDHEYSAGWDGDRLHVYRNEANETAYVWRLVWDSPADAEEFVDGYRQLLSYWGGEREQPGLWVIDSGGFSDSFAIEVNGDTVDIVNAPTTDQLSEVRAGVPEVTTPTNTPTEDHPTTESSPVHTTSEPGERRTESPTAGEGQSGFGVLVAIVAITALVLWRRG